MGYIVDLTVILNEISRAATGDVMSPKYAELTRSSLSGFKNRRGHRIHDNIRNYVEVTYDLQQKAPQDLFLAKVEDLIREHCAPPSGSGSRRDSEFFLQDFT
jgi:hypothetical protein